MISELDRLARVRERHAEPDPAALDRVRHEVVTRLDRPRPGSSARRWRIGVPVGLTAAAVAAIVGVTAAPGGVAQRPPAVGTSATAPAVPDGADAGTVMRLAAQTVAAEAPTAIGPTQVIYRQGRQVALAQLTVGDGSPLTLFVEQRHQSWLNPREGLRPLRTIAENGVSRRPATPADAALVKRFGYDLTAPPDRYDSDDPASNKKGPAQPDQPGPPSLRAPTAEYLAKLPTDPRKLLDLLRAAVRAEGNTKWTVDKLAFGIVVDLFTWGDPILSPRLRAGLLGAVALMPKVRRVSGQVDLAGRRGIAVGIAERDTRTELILDPKSLHPIGNRTVQLKAADGAPAGVVELSTFDFTVVDKVGSTG